MGGFSLSVASYVVNAKVPRFKRPKMCRNQNKSRSFPQKRPTFVELLSGFEPETSSLPTDSSPGNHWYPAVSGLFCSGKMKFSVLSAPLSPPATFPVWVRLWVSTQFATRRTGLIRRNFIAFSGVVSGQSSSKVIGIALARSNSFNSSDVNANSFFNSLVISAAFAIINTSFKAGSQPRRNQPSNLPGSSALINNHSLSIHNKQDIVYPLSILQVPNNRQISRRGIPYRIIAVFIPAVSLIV